MTKFERDLERAVREVGVNEVARRSGVPQSRISDWMRGARPLYLHRAEAIAEAVGYSLVALRTNHESERG